MVDPEPILANAKYLQHVRPVDPAEIQEYVPDRPHPGVIRQVLREHALELGFVERDDGTFVPASDEPVEPLQGSIEAVPERYARRLEDLLIEEYGAGWPEGESGDRLRTTIRRLKDAYYRGRPVEYDYAAALGYAIYHLPDYYAAVQYVLRELTEQQLLSRRLRILDVGAGVGGPALGLAEVLPDDALVEYHAVEPSAAADVLEALLEEAGRNVHPTIHSTTAEEFEPDGEYDLLLFANVLSELDDPTVVVRKYLDSLTNDGSAVLLSPADRNTARTLRGVERSLVDGPDAAATVYSPTVRLWPGEAPTDEGWSFKVAPEIDAPAFQRRLDEAADDPDHEPGEFVNTTVQYAYAILRLDGRRRVDIDPDPARWAKLADSGRHVSKRIDCMAVKLSADLSEEGNPLFRIGDGSEREDHFAVVPKRTALNGDLLTAEYGDLLTIESALVLWNDDEDAYNFVVDDETVVDRIPAPV